MTEAKNSNLLVRATGLLVIEVVNSNPNGDPAQESDPRMRVGERGETSPVSVKRKIRDLVEENAGPVWTEVSTRFKPALNPEESVIPARRGSDRTRLEPAASRG